MRLDTPTAQRARGMVRAARWEARAGAGARWAGSAYLGKLPRPGEGGSPDRRRANRRQRRALEENPGLKSGPSRKSSSPAPLEDTAPAQARGRLSSHSALTGGLAPSRERVGRQGRRRQRWRRQTWREGGRDIAGASLRVSAFGKNNDQTR